MVLAVRGTFGGDIHAVGIFPLCGFAERSKAERDDRAGVCGGGGFGSEHDRAGSGFGASGLKGHVRCDAGLRVAT